METVLEQDRQLLYDVFNRHYFSFYKKGEKSLEIFVNGDCKAHCEYCYLKKHQNELYPTELLDHPTIIHNFELLIDWYIENQFKCNIDFFSAEWLTTDLMQPIFDIMYQKFSNTEYKPKYILGADNFQFIWDDERTALIQSYIDKFEDDLNIKVLLSCSIDGAICDFGRTQGNEDFYKKVFAFCEKNDILCHPMVSPHNIDKWIDNYKWWVQNAPQYISESLMMLEVRNEDWTTERIEKLIQFCDFLIDYKFKYIFNENKYDFLKYILNVKNPKYPMEITGYNNIALSTSGFVNGTDTISCSFGHNIGIRLGDLSIAPCHRLWYQDLLIGKFKVENDKITTLEPINISLAILKPRLKLSCLPHCEKCQFIGCCVGFCLGNSYEVSKNFLIPTKEVCDMYKAKNTFLIYKYQQMGLWDLLDQLDKEGGYNSHYINYLQSLINSICPQLENNQEGECQCQNHN